MFILLVLLAVSLFFYSNVLYYSVSLVLFSLVILCILVKNFIISPIVIGLLIIVYVGAIMVLIGYICAVSPNIILSYSGSLTWSLFFLLVLSLSSSSLFPSSDHSFIFISEFFYGPSSFSWLFVIAFVLFLTLIIVTSQYLTPKGPFRSL